MSHLIVSGCSYTAYTECWPYMVSKHYGLTLRNMAVASAGNDWIAKSSIFAAFELLKRGIRGEDILLGVLWTHPDRKSFFIDENDTPEWHLLNYEYVTNSDLYFNPVSFIDAPLMDPDKQHPPSYCIQRYDNRKSAWVIGHSNTTTYGEADTEIDKFRMKYAETFFTKQGAMIELFENILQVQWFCKVHNIKLLNLYTSDKNLFFYPDGKIHVKQKYENVKHLFEMVDFSMWCKPGLIEYSRQNNLPFSDSSHPAESAHQTYVDNIIIPTLDKYFK